MSHPSGKAADAQLLARLRRAFAAFATALLVVVGVPVAPGAFADSAYDAVTLEIDKSVTIDGVVQTITPTLTVGDEFTWTLQLNCNWLTDACVDATVVDQIPDAFEILEDSIHVPLPSAQWSAKVEGQTVTIQIAEPLPAPAGMTGLVNTTFVHIPVRVRPLPYAMDGETIRNTATFDADNAVVPVQDFAEVHVRVDLELGATATKGFARSESRATPGQSLALSFGGSNTSNAAVDRLVLQDPANPAATPNVFQQFLQVASLGATSWPAGAGSAVVSVYDRSTNNWESGDPIGVGASLSLPAAVAAQNIGGVRVEFLADPAGDGIAIGAIASLTVNTALRDSVADLTADATINNVATAWVERGAEESEHPTASALHTLRFLEVAVSADKRFTPDEIATVSYEGGATSSVVRLSATNSGSTPLSELRILEPSHDDPAVLVTADNLLAPAYAGGGVLFNGFTDDLRWPAGATAASIIYYYADGTSSGPHSTTTQHTLAAAAADKRVVGFDLRFTGTITPSASAVVPFTVAANPEQTERLIRGSNEITVIGQDVDGAASTDQASAALDIYADQIAVSVSKRMTRNWLWSIPGQRTVVALGATVAPFPQSTQAASVITIDDPPAPAAGEPVLTDWYQHFNASQVTLAQIPGDATLTVQYLGSDGEYHDVPGMVGITAGSPQAPDGFFTQDLPASVQEAAYGIRFRYESATGFVPGQSLAANLTFATRSTLRDDGTALPDYAGGQTVCNLAAAQAANEDMSSELAELTDGCVSVQLREYGDPNDPNFQGPSFVDKSFDLTQIPSRNGEAVVATLRWGTGGYSNVATAVITDPNVTAAGTPLPVAETVFDAFNLVRIPAITTAVDPLIGYDQIRVELFDGTEWRQPTSGCRIDAPCNGSFPEYVLTSEEQASTVGVRFIVTERPDRTATTVFQPLPGTGVAAADDATRVIRLQFELRDVLRSDSTIPVTSDVTYNTVDPGFIRNDTTAQLFDAEHALIDDDSASATVELADPLLAVALTKSWTGGPVAVPTADETPAKDEYPSTRVTLTARNQTPGRVDRLSIIEPNPASATDNSFALFDLRRFHAITVPSGATTSVLTLHFASAPDRVISGTAASVRSAALALTEEELADVIGLQYDFLGRIQATSAQAVLTFDLRLRSQVRGSDPAERVLASTYPTSRNSAVAEVADLRFDPDTHEPFMETLRDDATAQVQLHDAGIGVTVQKQFSPATQTEPSTEPLTMNLRATPSGSERPVRIILTDERATFWNAFNFTTLASSFALPSFTPAGSPLRVLAEFCVGATFDAAAIDADPTIGCADLGGTWVTNGIWRDATSARTVSSLLTGALYEGVQITAEDVHGVRFTIERQDGSQWQNPHAPTITVPVQVVRRAELRSGGAVPSTLNDGGVSAPGETTKGRFTNELLAEIRGIWNGSQDATIASTAVYAHARNAVSVDKAPSGVKSPGEGFDYTLTVTNTGDRSIVNPVITDTLPTTVVDGKVAAELIFDPDADPEDWFRYALSGPATSTTPLPTVGGNVTVVQTSDELGAGPTELSFEFPEGAALDPGQTYTITIRMMFRPGVVEGVPVTNSLTVLADRYLDGCSDPTGADAVLVQDGYACRTSTTVIPDRLPSIRTVKMVKPLDAEGKADYSLGFAAGTGCAAALREDYTVQPCVPRVMPGQEQEWRLQFQNTGTTEITRVVVADVLPTPGDRTLLAGFPRNSNWSAVLSDTAPVLSPSVPGRTLTTYVTTAAPGAVCLDVLRAPENLDACPSDVQTGWVTWDDARKDNVALEDVTALQFVVEHSGGASFAPAEFLNITFRTKAAAYSDVVAEDSRALNSLSTSAVSRFGAQTILMRPVDQSNVGVAMATGSLQIVKNVEGDAAEHVPATQIFRGQLLCTSLGEVVPARDFSVVVGEPTVITALPAHAECTVEETDASGQSSYAASTVTVVPSGAAAELPVITITNQYDYTDLVVRKTVTADGATVVPTGFQFSLTCTFLGQAVPLAPGTPTPTVVTFELDEDGEYRHENIPVHSNCVVTETDDRDAEATIVSGSSVGGVTLNQTARSVTFSRLAPKPVTGEANVATFNNRFGVASALVVEKQVVGGAAGLAQDLAFEVEVVCTFSGEEQHAGTYLLSASNGWTVSIDGFLVGTECEIRETNLDPAHDTPVALLPDAVLITPNDGDPTVGVITIGNTPASTTVTVANRYLAGEVAVTKVVDGDGANLYGTGLFQIQLVCVLDDEAVPVTVAGSDYPADVDPLDPATVIPNGVAWFSGGDTVTFGNLPSGAECTLTELDAAGAGRSTIEDEDGDTLAAADDGYTFTVTIDPALPSNLDQAQPPLTVRNTFNLAEVIATKTVQSEALGADGLPIEYGPFELTLECMFQGEPVTPAESTIRTLGAGETVRWTDLPEGADCAITETDSADAIATTMLLGTLDEPTDTVEGTSIVLAPLRDVSAAEPNEVQVINRFDATTLTVLKQVFGVEAKYARDHVFVVDVTCTLIDASHLEPGLVVRTATLQLSRANHWTSEMTALPVGADCTIIESDYVDAIRTEMVVDGHTEHGTMTTVQLHPGGTSSAVQVRNLYGGELLSTGIELPVLLSGAMLLLGGGLVSLGLAGRRRARQV